MAFGERLKEARLMRGYTQKQLAEKLGIAGTTVTGYEKNNSEPNMLVISKIMNILNVDANFLFQDDIEKSESLPKESEYRLIKKYSDLDQHGKEMVDFVLDKEHKRSVDKKDNITEMPQHLEVNAAHERTNIDFTEEERQEDDNMLD